MRDYDGVLTLWQDAGPGIELRPSDTREEVAKRCLRDRELFLVAEQRERIIGVVMGGWDGRRGWVHHLAVAGDARGQGVARDLMAALEGALRAIGCLKVNLLVREGNSAARALYRALGYHDSTGLVPMGKELERPAMDGDNPRPPVAGPDGR
jgi:ribosomal protein S18 acetylase RimI-like enzyme